MNTDHIKPLIKAVKQSVNKKILNYYSARSLTIKQKMMFLRHGIQAECRRRSNAWFEIDLICS
jgi:hypothetical protein